MPSVRNLVITYDRLNDDGTFSEGDTITGKVTLELEKETKIESLSVKAKGDVSVHWSEKHGDHSTNYSAQARLFKLKHFLIAQEANDTKLPPGVHIFKFSVSIPSGNMPSSFRGNHGKVVYKLEAKLCRSWRMDRTDDKEICFWSKSFPNIDQMKFPLAGSVNKEVGVFSKGPVQMDVTVDRRGYAPGDTVLIQSKINNSSSKDATPKFSLIQDVVYRASGRTKYEKHVIQEEIGETIKPQTLKELRCSMKIPRSTPLSIQNCNILSVEYRIKGKLHISFSSDPKIVFPVVLCVIPHAAGGTIEGPSTSNFPPQVPFASPTPHSGASMYPTTSQYPTGPQMHAGATSLYPMSPGHVAGGYNSAQLPNSYSYRFSSSSTASVLHPPPPASLIRPPSPSPANPQFSSAPPCYNTLDPPPQYPSALLPSEITVPSAPMMTENFLSHSAEGPPSYETLSLHLIFQILDFKLKYEALNKQNTFAAGDSIKGTVTFTLTEDVKIKGLYVKAKGDAHVHWSEGHGEHRRTHTKYQRFYKAKEFLIPENKDETVLQSGDHRYQFSLKIPDGNIPASFKGYHGRISHVLHAKLSRSWHMATSEKKDLNFTSRTFLSIDQTPQAGSVDKKVGTFSKGQVHLSATVNKRFYSPGEIVHVSAKIKNKSSKKMRIKFSIDQKSVYRAYHHAKIQNGTVCKIAGETIEPDFEGDVTCPVTIPADIGFSILNCEIITVEFYLKVYLDISFGFDPEVSLPLIIACPGLQGQHGQHGFQNVPGAIYGQSSSDFPPPFPGPYPVPAGPPNAYAYPPPGPNQYTNIPPGGYYNPTPGYNNQPPQQPIPYGYPGAPVMPYQGQPPVSTMNSQFPQDQPPPSYMSIYPPSQSGTEMDKKTEL
ncbi:hypothetical protein WMY93_004630 [Mugilogobius chulae]|uniref:Arrestin C-terminal-like domain-containing protein n=1 Tax=Mugilogobius chulae TaxID=88201 RepID=A0AAW0PRQ2_9GOBI